MSNEIIKTINQIAGFDPSSLVRPIEEGGKLYLHLAEREMWFRLKYPNGKIKQEILKHENGTVLARATIYADYSAEETHFLAQAYGAYTNSTLPEQARTLADQLEFACSRATSRALKAAGFSTQAALGVPMDADGEDPKPSDTPVVAPQPAPVVTAKGSSPVEQTVRDKKNLTTPAAETNDPPAEELQENGSAECLQENADKAMDISETGEMETAPVGIEQALNYSFSPDNHSAAEIVQNSKTVDEWRDTLTVEEAGDVVITCLKSEEKGKGKTIAWLATNKPNVLQWLVEKSGKDEDFPKEVAAAQVLFHAARESTESGK